ncbi:MAG TPA: hypothetical protein VEJ36_06205 [Nitrososphaerales archaeon]|nr:hypothetical protein [Nitrososphaerales archaeon]
MSSVRAASISATLLLVFILAAGFLIVSPASSASSPPAHVLGFWVDDGSFGGITASQFVKGYFGTPPYPYFALISMGFDAPSLTASRAISVYVPILQAMASSYPDAKLIFQVFMFAGVVQTLPEQLGNFSAFMKALEPYSSQIIGVTWEDEYLNSTVAPSVWSQMRGNVTADGFKWIQDSGNPENDDTDPNWTYLQWPFAGTEIGISDYGTETPNMGAMIGFQSIWDYVYEGTGANAFPSTCTASELPASDVEISTSPNCQSSYNQLIVNHILGDFLERPGETATWLILVPGYSSNGCPPSTNYCFAGDTGLSGQTAMWDNPILRGLIYDSPSYAGSFTLSTGVIASDASTSTQSSSSSTTSLKSSSSTSTTSSGSVSATTSSSSTTVQGSDPTTQTVTVTVTSSRQPTTQTVTSTSTTTVTSTQTQVSTNLVTETSTATSVLLWSTTTATTTSTMSEPSTPITVTATTTTSAVRTEIVESSVTITICNSGTGSITSEASSYCSGYASGPPGAVPNQFMESILGLFSFGAMVVVFVARRGFRSAKPEMTRQGYSNPTTVTISKTPVVYSARFYGQDRVSSSQ